MKLYQSDLSPYASRCRIQTYAKGIDDIEKCEPPGSISSDLFKRINPSGKIQVMEVDGLVLGEAQIICEYLEGSHAEPSLRPSGDLARARVQLLCQVADLYIPGPLFVMLESYLTNTGLDGGDYAVGGRLSLADCALVPTLFVAVDIMPGSGTAEPLAAMPALARYWHAIQKDEYCGRVLAERTATLEARMGIA